MRVWVCTLTLLGVLMGVHCQRGQQAGGGSHLNTHTRLGLVSTDLGLPPVPGGQPGNTVHPLPQGCFCLPANQACPSPSIAIGPNQPIPDNLGHIDVRIVNTPTGSLCPNPDQKLCCTPGTNPVHPNPPVNTVRPIPVPPVPVQLGGCGVSNPIPYRQAVHPEATFGEYPWMAVVLDLNDGYLGGGVLISSEWVLTAAHKVNENQRIKVRLGEHDVSTPVDNPQLPHLEVAINRIIIHPHFNAKTLANDVALLQLSRRVNTQNYPHIGTACLPEQNQLFHSQSCWVTGWGKDAFEQSGNFQYILKEVDVPVVDPFQCQARLRASRLGPNFVLDQKSFLCAGGIEGKDACTGDGGAPLVCRTNKGWTVVGLVAWGIGCARNELPGVYVNIPTYVSFIRSIVGSGF